MPSFDIVSEVDKQEVDNALNQARKELAKLVASGIDDSFARMAREQLARPAKSEGR